MSKAFWQWTNNIQMDKFKSSVWNWKVAYPRISSLGLLGKLTRVTGLDKPDDIILHLWPAIFLGCSSENLSLTSMISMAEEIESLKNELIAAKARATAVDDGIPHATPRQTTH